MVRIVLAVVEVAYVKIASVRQMDVIVCPVVTAPAHQFVAQVAVTPSGRQFVLEIAAQVEGLGVFFN